MAIDSFEKWLAAFGDEDELTAFNLAVVAEGLDIIKDLNDQNVGGETVEERIGEYKSWDPEIFRVDKDTEVLVEHQSPERVAYGADAALKRISGHKYEFKLLSFDHKIG